MIAVHSMHARPSLDLCIHAVDNKVVSFLNTIKRNMIAAWTCESLFLEYQFSFTLYFCWWTISKSFTEKSLTWRHMWLNISWLRTFYFSVILTINVHHYMVLPKDSILLLSWYVVIIFKVCYYWTFNVN
jgi:hypothetical protein